MAKNGFLPTNFIDNYRESVGYVAPPVSGASGQLGIRKQKLTPMQGNSFHVNWTEQNKGIDSWQNKQNFLNKLRASHDNILYVKPTSNGISLLKVTPITKMIEGREDKHLWRLDGKNANVKEYEAKLDEIKKEINASNSIEDTVNILKRNAKNWDLNMYMLGTDSGRAAGLYDWSPAAMFQTELEEYPQRFQMSQEGEYTNNDWKKDLIQTIESSLTTKGSKILNPGAARLT